MTIDGACRTTCHVRPPSGVSISASLRSLKLTLTSIGTSAKEVHAGLDRLRDGILARLTEAEAELRRI
jgi:hypothetical protein